VVTPLEAGTSVGEARRRLAQAFAAQALEASHLEARLLVGHALGLDHAGLITADATPLTGPDCARIQALAHRRLAREPVSRIIGEKEFFGLSFALSPEVLVPRPETEILVETALQALEADPRRELRIADLGTGSGAILLSLLQARPDARGVGTDRSEPALRVARCNAVRLGLAARAAFLACDFAGALGAGFDLLVSNPPYVVRTDLPHLEPEVRDHDPHLALDGGPDGLAGYRRIAADAMRVLAPGGHLVVELGAGQAPVVAALFTRAGLISPAPPRRDLCGIERALDLLRPS
jgi:release factor glutamine methyltransferase